MVTHEGDMAQYAKRIVHFVDGVVASDARNAHPTAFQIPVKEAA
jgi:putative ABC transport system ATP-binding protein